MGCAPCKAYIFWLQEPSQRSAPSCLVTCNAPIAARGFLGEEAGSEAAGKGGRGVKGGRGSLPGSCYLGRTLLKIAQRPVHLASPFPFLAAPGLGCALGTAREAVAHPLALVT